jgi:nucleoside-diphosphate-sugar epimerase
MQRIVVIGGTKFIGPHVVTQLANLGHIVAVYHRGESECKLPASVRHVHSADAGMPVRRFPPELLKPAPDIVIHMIAMGEEDSRAAVEAFRGRVERMVWLSSGDVYRAYGRFMGLESGAVDNNLLTEDSPLRSVRYPYRSQAKTSQELSYYYDKILVEQIAMSDSQAPAVILRLPKVYGPNGNADLASIYGFRNHPQWRWTHGYVENVAAAIVLAALNPAAVGRIFNVGEAYTPTMAERLESMPESAVQVDTGTTANFEQNIAYDTGRIRRELGYSEIVSESEGLRRTLFGL